jgi:hypothetical protein
MWKGEIGVGMTVFVEEIIAQTFLQDEQLRSVAVPPSDTSRRRLHFRPLCSTSQTHLPSNEPPESLTNVSHATTSSYTQIIAAGRLTRGPE